MVVFRVVHVLIAIIAVLMTGRVMSQDIDCSNSSKTVELMETNDDVMEEFCRKQFYKCFADGCAPQWSRDIADGVIAMTLMMMKMKSNWIKMTYGGEGNWLIYIQKVSYLIFEAHLPWYVDNDRPEMPLNYNQDRTALVRHPTKGLAFNTNPLIDGVNMKGLTQFTLKADNKDIQNLTIFLYYPTSFVMSFDEPLYDNLIIGPLNEYLTAQEAYFNLPRYYDFKVPPKSIVYDFQAIDVGDNFYFKYNRRIQALKVSNTMSFCEGSKLDPQTGVKYGTGEGCRVIHRFKNRGNKIEWLWGDYENSCECDFDSLGFDEDTAKKDELKQVTESKPGKPGDGKTFVDGFNFPDGEPKPVKRVVPSDATVGTYTFALVMIWVIFVIIMIITILGIYLLVT